MAIIDYSDVLNLGYAKLSLPAKALIPVLATLADKKTGLLPERFSKLDTLATFAGISRRATQIALQLLGDTKRISISLVHGHPAQILYQPIAQFSSRAGEAPRASLERHDVPLQPELTLSPDQPPEPPEPERQEPCLNSSLKQFKTTTDSIPKGVLRDMLLRYGATVVVSVLSGMKNMEGEIANPAAYFRKCCQENWVPSNKKIRDEEAARVRIKRRDELQEERNRETDAHHRRIEAENDDPDVQDRIKRLQQQLWTNLNASPPDAISGHAMPQKYFQGGPNP